MIKFQRKLNKSYPWMNQDKHTNIMNEILDVKNMRNEWLKMEKERINTNSILINITSINNDGDSMSIFDIHHNQFIDKSRNNYFMTNAAYDILIILQSIKYRIELIINTKYKQLFIKELIIQILNLCSNYIEDQFPNYIHYRVGMSDDDISNCCGIINSTDYLIQFLLKWNDDQLFRSLQVNFFSDIIHRNKTLKDKHIIGLCDVICHEFILEFTQYQLFNFITKQQLESNTSNNINFWRISRWIF